MSSGKWIGGVLGFIVGGPLGAVAGFALGALFDGSSSLIDTAYGSAGTGNPYQGQSPYEGTRNSFLFSMLVMASYIIRADGKIMHSEMEYVRGFLRRNFGEAAVSQGEEILLRLFEEAKRREQADPAGYKLYIRSCGNQIAQNLGYGERLQLLAFLAEIAKSDKFVCQAEIDALKEVAVSMGLSEREIESMLNLGGNSLEDAYKVLEIEPTASDDEVRAAYRRMAIKHHPDKVANLGEDIRKAATEKLQKINEAKERIYKERGMK